MGRPQHRVRNSSELDLRARSLLPVLEDDALSALSSVRFHSRGGRDDEQARQSGEVRLESRGMSLFQCNAVQYEMKETDSDSGTWTFQYVGSIHVTLRLFAGTTY